MKFKNVPMVPRVVYGKGSLEMLESILQAKRVGGRFVFLIDAVFAGEANFLSQIPLSGVDERLFIATDREPHTEQVDALVAGIKAEMGGLPAGVVGIGGGSVMDLAKAVAIMLTNRGKTEQYQGWDLVTQPAVYHLGVPTLSGTGAEVSRTAVLTGSSKKLGINSDYTTFDQVVLDPDLTRGAPTDQWFYTGMDCYIHSVESLSGTYLNGFSQSHGEKAFELCKEVFLESGLSEAASREKLMMASWHGGMSIAYSQVGVAHALSYGLSYVLGIKHGLGNCLVFDQLEAYYPEGVRLFKQMKEKQGIDLPKGVCARVSEGEMNEMIAMALSLEPLWENALGRDWRKRIDAQQIRQLYEKI